MSFGDVELAAVDTSLDALNRNQSLTIQNPLPADELLLSICLGYIRLQNPRFPTKGIIGQGKSLCLFPALSKGYVTNFDNIRRTGVGEMPKLIDRESIGAMSEIDGEADLYTAKHGIGLDTVPQEIGALIVDLRKREWRQPTARLEELKEYVDQTPVPVIYYLDEERSQFDPLLEGTERITIDNKLLTTARPELSEHATTLSTYASILTSGERTVQITAIHHPEMQSVIRDLGNMKRDLQNVPGLQTEVGWLFNLLTELPVRPQYWEQAVQDNFHHQSVADLIQNLRAKTNHLEGMTADLLVNYAQAGSYLQQLLNRSHPLQEALFDRLAEADAKKVTTRFVVRNEYERDAINAALAAENRQMPTHAELIPIADLKPDPDVPTVFTRPMRNARYVYGFPPSRTVEFVQFDMWADYVESHLQETLEGTDTTVTRREYNEPVSESTHAHRSHASSGSQAAAGPANTQGLDDKMTVEDNEAPANQSVRGDSMSEFSYEAPNYDNPDELLEEVLAAEFSKEIRQSAGGASSGDDRSGDVDFSGPKKRIIFQDGDSIMRAPSSRVTITSGDNIVRISVAELEPGDEVLLVDNAQNDVYDLFIKSTHERDKVRGSESTIERWRSILQDGLDTEYSAIELIDEMEEHGSTIGNVSTILGWRSGRTLGPRNPDDVKYVLEILAPDQTSLATPTVNALKEIRGLHRKIGRETRRLVEAKQAGASLPSGVNSVDGNIDTATKQKVIAEVTNVE
ncbi:hypothetical protein CP556_05535 [Natrinema sp. CBA1119]|nr:hypothetical protein CP556_05535 [Natrinema sp. CBA1119]